MRKTSTPKTAGLTRRKRMMIAILGFVIAIVSVAATPASATDSWTWFGDNIVVSADHTGMIVRILVNRDGDGNWDLDFRTRSDGSLAWVGEDTDGGSKLETWTYIYTNGDARSFIDSNENGTIELEYYDFGGDGKNEWVRQDTSGNGWADTWSRVTTYSSDSSDAGLGIGMLRFIFNSAARSS